MLLIPTKSRPTAHHKDMATLQETIDKLFSARNVQVIKKNTEGRRRILYEGDKEKVPNELLDAVVIHQRYWHEQPHWELVIK